MEEEGTEKRAAAKEAAAKMVPDTTPKIAIKVSTAEALPLDGHWSISSLPTTAQARLPVSGSI